VNAEDATQLCRIAKTISPAQAVDEFTPAAWALILEDIRFVDARQALKELGGEQQFIHVSDIVKRVKRIRRNRVLDFGTLPDPPRHIDPDNVAQHKRWLKETTEAIADGTYQAPAPEAIEGQRRDIRALGQAQSVDAALATRPLREAHAEAKRELQAADARREQERRERRVRMEELHAADRAARARITEAARQEIAAARGTTEESA
jgi:hypothetical protein